MEACRPESLVALVRASARFAAGQLERAGGGPARRVWAVRRLRRLAELLDGIKR